MSTEDRLQERLERLTAVGIALSAERDLNELLDLIVDEARALTGADGGTLYLAEGDPAHSLRYFVMQNASLNIHLGGATGKPIPFPSIPLTKEGLPNNGNISAYAANTGKTVTIADCYLAEGFDFTGPKVFDQQTGYRSGPFLVVPMRDHEEQLIGVLQLINATHRITGQTIPFSAGDAGLIESLASQAAVAITNVQLIRDTENLFEAFADVMASAIDERSPATAGHIKRVMALTLALAEAVNQQAEGPYANVRFTPEELNELRLAALLHDVGKVTTPVHIVEKRNKLETVYDRGHEVRTRFDLIRTSMEAEGLRRRVARMERGAPPEELAELDADLAARMQEAAAEQAFIMQVNAPVEFLPPEKVERIRAIGAKTFRVDGEERPYLTADELRDLTVQKGNISGEELQIMRDHAAMSIKLLSQIPFTRKLRNIPRYAGAHHEFLNGKGYPQGLQGEEIALQTRMMSIADVFDAITAEDRSYKKPRSQEDALRILGFMAKDGEVDGALVDLFVRSGVYKLVGKSAGDMMAAEAAAASM